VTHEVLECLREIRFGRDRAMRHRRDHLDVLALRRFQKTAEVRAEVNELIGPLKRGAEAGGIAFESRHLPFAQRRARRDWRGVLGFRLRM
jgi:hypothetical protein